MINSDGFGDQAWFDAWYDAFAPDAPRYPLSLGGRDFEPDLMEGSVPILRRSWRFLRAPVNAHVPQYGWKLNDMPRAQELDRRFRELLKASGSHGVELALVPDGSPTLKAIHQLSTAGAWVVSIEECEQAQVIETDGDWDAYWSSLSGEFRRHLNKQQRQLQQLGQVTFVNATETDSWRTWLERALVLEAAGWKGRDGGAILRGSPETQFYQRVAESAAEKRRLHLYVLLLDDRAIASYLMIADGVAVFALKTAYDEAFARYGPGVLLLRWSLMECFRDPSVVAMNIPGAPGWTRRWPGRLESLVRVRALPAGSVAGLALGVELRAKDLRAWIGNRLDRRA